MKKTDLAYVAGIVDGEGSIRIARRKVSSQRPNKKGRQSYFLLVVEVGNTQEWLIQWLRLAFGGSIVTNPAHGQRQTFYRWVLQNKAAAAFLFAVLPYLRIKRPEAEIALAFQARKKYRGCKGMTEEEYALQEAQHILMRKRRGERTNK